LIGGVELHAAPPRRPVIQPGKLLKNAALNQFCPSARSRRSSRR
jgi:hypothetical protein